MHFTIGDTALSGLKVTKNCKLEIVNNNERQDGGKGRNGKRRTGEERKEEGRKG